MRKFLLIFLILLISVTQSHSKSKFCFVQLASFKNLNFAERLFENVKTDRYKYLIKSKSNGIYAVRVGYFKNLEICRLRKEKLRKNLKKYRIKPAIILSRFSLPSNNFVIIKETIPRSETVKGKKMEEKSQQKLIGIRRKSFSPKKNHKRMAISKESKKNSSSLVYLYIEKAKVCMGKKDCTNAVKYLKLAISKQRKNPKLYTYLGYAYLHLGMYAKALNAYREALQIEPDYAEAYAGIGFLYLKLNSPKVAAIAFKKAHRLNPKELSYSVNLAISLLESGDIDRAITEFQNLKNEYPFLPEIYYNEAVAYVKRGNYRKAADGFEIFLELTKDNKFYKSYRRKVLEVLNQINSVLESKNER